jgi:hypothetical protein
MDLLSTSASHFDEEEDHALSYNEEEEEEDYPSLRLTLSRSSPTSNFYTFNPLSRFQVRNTVPSIDVDMQISSITSYLPRTAP